MKHSALVLLLFLLSGCVSNPARENGGSDDLLQLRQQAAATYQVHDYQKALPLYERLVEAIPGDALLWFRLGNLRARAAQPDQAIEAYRKAVQLNPALDRAWHNMLILYLRQATNSLTRMLQYADPKGAAVSTGARVVRWRDAFARERSCGADSQIIPASPVVRRWWRP